MRNRKRKENYRKAISLLLVYALFANELIPLARAASHSHVPVYSTHLKSPRIHLENFRMIPELEQSPEIKATEIATSQATVMSTSGPVDPNLVSMGSSEMVNLASGDFSYSIPLLQVGDYPITLSYNADVTMDQAASIVGLGWNISTAAINRTVRGLPDDFDGDQIRTTMNLRPNLSVSQSTGVSLEVFGWDKNLGHETWSADDPSTEIIEIEGGPTGTLENSAVASLNFSNTFNNYSGTDNSFGVNGSFSQTKKNFEKGELVKSSNWGLSAGTSSSSRSGLSSNLGANLSLSHANGGIYRLGLGLNRNSLNGSSLNSTFGVGYSWTKKINGKKVKNRGFRTGISGGSSWPIGFDSYTPTANFDFTNKALSFNIDFGTEIWVHPHIKYTYTIYQNCLAETTKSESAYGYMNLEKAYPHPDAVQDFNLSMPSIHEEIERLNTPIPTYDYFTSSVSGDMYRAIRNDAGYVRDAETKSRGQAPSASGELGVGSGVNVGLNIDYNWNNSSTGPWEENNPFSEDDKYEYSAGTPHSDPIVQAKYEHVNFQKVNNRSTLTEDQYSALKGEEALHQGIQKSYGKIKGDGFFATDKDDVTTYDVTINQHYQHERRDRNVLFQYRTNRELTTATQHEFPLYTLGDFSFDPTVGGYIGVDNQRSSTEYPSNHIGEISIIRSGGGREVYGIPVMNNSQQVSFNMSAVNNYTPGNMNLNRTFDNEGLITYDPTKDNTTGNKRGKNFYYLKNEVPNHAVSYLMTEMVSGNYTDLEGDGPSPDDLGDYVRFNYAKVGTAKWRFPFQENKATFSVGMRSDALDDMASYQYGEREAYLVHSIESKDFIAEFEYGEREDGYNVSGENGGIGTENFSRRLIEIRLYTRKGKELGEGPVKKVNFLYSYQLCQGTPDNINGEGKLTLMSLYFTNYDSPKGKLYKYKFSYGPWDAVNNPDYDLTHKDRWGTFRNDGVTIDYGDINQLNNDNYPYSDQTVSSADQSVLAWKLKTIDLPSGSRIEVDYESDSYEYVQDHEATRMYKVLGYHAWEDGQASNISDLSNFDHILYETKDENRYAMLIELDQPITATSSPLAAELFKKEFLPLASPDGGSRYLYYNISLNLAPHRKKVIDPDVHDRIQGYADIKNGGWTLLESNTGSGIYDRVVLELNPDNINSGGNIPLKEVHPISRKAWQVINEAMPHVLYPNPKILEIYNKDNLVNCGSFSDLQEGDETMKVKPSVESHKKNLLSIPTVYHMMLKTGYGSKAEGAGWVRMRCGEQSKLGGGHRVKSIKVYDNWDDFVAGENESVYGTQYEYTTTDQRGNTVSSGVASYEPLNGGDEIALRRPHFYIHKGKSVPNERFYTELPLNEEVFANSTVKYSTVKVSSIDYAGLTLNTPGYTKFEHYTAKDYPLVFDYTDTDSELKKPGIANIIGVSKRRFGISHGTSVRVNDMHGKFKGKYVYSAPHPSNPEGNLIYKEEHFYRENTDGTLLSKVPVIHKDGTKSDQLLGLNIDFLTHLNQSVNNNYAVKLAANLEYNPPISIVPSVWPGAENSEVSTYSSLTTKIIYQSGILERIVVDDNGRFKSTTNLLYDAKTGAPLVTEVAMEQPGAGVTEQKTYVYNYPAHWAYPGMEIGSENINIRRNDILDGNNYILTGEAQYFFPGDVVQASTGAIVHVVQDESNNRYFLANADGTEFVDPGTGTEYRVLLPGRKNFTGAPMASVTTLDTYPTTQSPYDTLYIHTRIIGIAGTDFFEKAKLEGSCFAFTGDVGDPINPYRYNLLGQWKQHNSYSFDHDRDYTQTGTRNDGLLTTYQPFWKNQGGTWLPIYNSQRSDYDPNDPLQNWIHTSEATLFNHRGMANEAENALDIKSASYVGYNYRHSKASVTNSRYEESGFDGFEDYLSDGEYSTIKTEFTPFSCINDHFRLNAPTLKNTEAHTGNYSVQVTAGNYVAFTSEVWDGTPENTYTHDKPFRPNNGDLIKSHRFVNAEAENKYVVTAWVKEDNTSAQLLDYQAAVRIALPNQQLMLVADEKRSNIIDGWQRIELTFEMGSQWADGEPVEIRLEAGNNYTAYFDDVRVHPFDSEMEAQVIDADEQRPMSTLDNRNFSTTIQYDEEGIPVRTIQETERGKQTIQESRTGVKTIE